jgi:hypothetical protein
MLNIIKLLGTVYNILALVVPLIKAKRQEYVDKKTKGGTDGKAAN